RYRSIAPHTHLKPCTGCPGKGRYAYTGGSALQQTIYRWQGNIFQILGFYRNDRSGQIPSLLLPIPDHHNLVKVFEIRNECYIYNRLVIHFDFLANKTYVGKNQYIRCFGHNGIVARLVGERTFPSGLKRHTYSSKWAIAIRDRPSYRLLLKLSPCAGYHPA